MDLTGVSDEDRDAAGSLLSDLDDAELDRLLAQAAPGLRAAIERCTSPEASAMNGHGGFNSFVDADS